MCAMEIRRYKRGEEAAIWKVYFAATHESNARDYHADLIERWAPHDQDMGQWNARLAQKNPFVAVADGEIVGMAEIERDGFIDYFYVHPRWQGRGIGTALLATLEAEAGPLEARQSNVILGHPAPNYRMQKRLSSETDGAANRSQPIRAESNRTPRAAGSDR